MRTWRMTLPLAALAVACIAAPATAQELSPNARDGIYASLGVGGGFLGCFDGCDDVEPGYVGVGRVGWTLNRYLRIGVGVDGWYKSIDQEWYLTSLFSGQVQYFPGGGNLFLTGGAGLLLSDCEECGEAETDAAFLLGIGYDAPIGRGGKLALTPFLNGILVATDESPFIFEFGLALTLN